MGNNEIGSQGVYWLANALQQNKVTFTYPIFFVVLLN
jgi:hypothetical protein